MPDRWLVGWEFLAGTIGGWFVGMFGYLFASTLLESGLGLQVPDLFSTTGMIIVLLVAIRIGQWRVDYWQQLNQAPPQRSTNQ